LIGNILDLSALEAGKVQLDVAPVDAQMVFGYLRAMATTLAEESGKTLEIAVTADPAMAAISVDEEKFLRIMINLLSNAVKFTPSGGRIALTAAADDEGGLHVVVSDTGVGIPLDYHESVFQPFRRVPGAASGQQQGTGLGLAVVRQLTELHRGRVWVESTPGEGASFHVLLPQALSPSVGERVESLAPLAAQSSPSAGARSKGTVLVVEDTDAHMNLMRLAVTSRGYAMHGVGSGEEALSWLADHRPDVVLLDMQLPGMDGFSVAAHLKGHVETHSIPLIAVTADALSINEQRARASGCDAYLTKPIDIATLLATIDGVVSHQ
jgi:CheY-like chemotaxis protein/anti-sigma regulatory factor (Ser/Thr protein kinase)